MKHNFANIFRVMVGTLENPWTPNGGGEMLFYDYPIWPPHKEFYCLSCKRWHEKEKEKGESRK